jgi:hypothetical protein
MMRRNVIGCVVVAAAVLMSVAGCDKGKPAASNPKAPTNTTVVIPATYFVETEPPAAKPIIDVKKDARAGDEVVMRGRIAGRKDPFTAGRASFMMTDLSLAVCEDGCKTPWDHCCDEPKEIAAVAATVQLVDEKGEVLKTDAKGVHGLTPNAELVVVGKVKSKDDTGNMVVDVKQVYVKKS